MNKKYHYFYKITNLINNHFYYGVHNTDNLDDGYMGSGTRLHYAYKKYGIKNFSKEIIKFFDSAKEAFEYEEQIVNENLINDNKCYNCCNGGINPKLLSKETQNKKQETFKNHKHQQGQNNSQYGTYWINNGVENKKIKKEEVETYISLGWIKGKYFKPKKYLNSQKDHIRKVKFIQHIITNEIKCILINDSFDNNWKEIKMYDAKLRTKLSKELLGFSQKGKNNSQYGTCWINNGKDICKKIKLNKLEEYIKLGWYKGQLKYIWINNSIINTRVLEHNLDEYLKNGWKKGKIKRNN